MSTKHLWATDAPRCDVVDQVALAQLRAHVEVWVTALDGDDKNSVTSQIHEMMWMDAAWRSLNETRRLTQGSADAGTPSIVASLLDRGYISGQVLAIGRLLDRSAQNPKKTGQLASKIG